MEPKIDEQDFRLWKEDKVTKAIIANLEEMLERVNEQRLNKKYVQDSTGLLKLNYFLGYADALSDTLDITIESEEEDEKA